MLTASLVLSAVLLLVVNLAARYAKHPVFVTLGSTAGITILPVCVFVFFPAVWLQAAIVFAGGIVCAVVGCRSRWLSAVSIASVLIAYGYVGFSPRQQEREYAQLRAQYPFESMENRLPPPVTTSASGDPDRLDYLEKAIATKRHWVRQEALSRLHNEAVQRFALTPGLGVGRMGSLTSPSEWTLQPEPRDKKSPEQEYPNSLRQPEEQPTPRTNQTAIDKLHEEGVLDFVNPRGFGYVKDRQHVAGFQSHGFSQPPQTAGRWKVQTVDLVGLLLHDTPVVYISAKLPKMEELHNAPTRPLDSFEMTALETLRAGADMHLTEGSDGVRLMGSLRNVKQCMECHGGERGALLGAFSYRLQAGR